MPLVDEQRADRTWTTVEVLVRAPRGEVDLSVVELEGDVAGRMGQVPPDDGTGSAAGRGQPRDVVRLSGRKVHASEEHEGELVGMVSDGTLDITRPQRRLTGSWRHDDQVADRIESARREMARERVAVRREQRRVDKDSPARP